MGDIKREESLTTTHPQEIHSLPTGFLHVDIVQRDERTFLVFTGGELRLRVGRMGRLELLPTTPAALDSIRAIADGAIRVRSSYAVELRLALDDGAAAFIEVRDAGTPGEGRTVTSDRGRLVAVAPGTVERAG